MIARTSPFRPRRTAAVGRSNLAAVTLACLAAIGCSGSSPTAPPVPTGGLSIVLEDDRGLLAGREGAIRTHIESAYQEVARQLKVDGLVITVTPGPRFLTPGWGVGGSAESASRVEIAVDKDLSLDLLAARLPSIVAHELHHVARIRGPGYGDTLLEAMVSEGLADHYAEELFGEPLPPWTTVLSEVDMVFYIDLARAEFDSKTYDHSDWFFGTGTIPRWTGYSIGFRLVSDYKNAHPGATAVSLVAADAGIFRPD